MRSNLQTFDATKLHPNTLRQIKNISHKFKNINKAISYVLSDEMTQTVEFLNLWTFALSGYRPEFFTAFLSVGVYTKLSGTRLTYHTHVIDKVSQKILNVCVSP